MYKCNYKNVTVVKQLFKFQINITMYLKLKHVIWKLA